MERGIRYLLVVFSAYMAAQMLADVSSLRIYVRWARRFGMPGSGAASCIRTPRRSGRLGPVRRAGDRLRDLSAGISWSIFWVNVSLKGLIMVISVPWIYLVRPSATPSGTA